MTLGWSRRATMRISRRNRSAARTRLATSGAMTFRATTRSISAWRALRDAPHRTLADVVQDDVAANGEAVPLAEEQASGLVLRQEALGDQPGGQGERLAGVVPEADLLAEGPEVAGGQGAAARQGRQEVGPGWPRRPRGHRGPLRAGGGRARRVGGRPGAALVGQKPLPGRGPGGPGRGPRRAMPGEEVQAAWPRPRAAMPADRRRGGGSSSRRSPSDVPP